MSTAQTCAVEASSAADSPAASAWLDSVQRLAIPPQPLKRGQSARMKHIVEMALITVQNSPEGLKSFEKLFFDRALDTLLLRNTQSSEGGDRSEGTCSEECTVHCGSASDQSGIAGKAKGIRMQRGTQHWRWRNPCPQTSSRELADIALQATGLFVKEAHQLHGSSTNATANIIAQLHTKMSKSVTAGQENPKQSRLLQGLLIREGDLQSLLKIKISAVTHAVAVARAAVLRDLHRTGRRRKNAVWRHPLGVSPKLQCSARRLGLRLLTAAVLTSHQEVFNAQKATCAVWRGCNEGVLQLHAHYAAELQATKERAAQERMAFLRANDVKAYLQLAQSAKNSKLNELLSSTDACLRQLTTRLSLASSVLTKMPRSSGVHVENEQGDLMALKESAMHWNDIANRLRVDIKKLPHMLQGGQLRSYQLEGVGWMVSLHDHGLNGILADEMGLGKTIQIIALIAYLVEKRDIAGPFLVVAPSSVVPNWEAEFERWAPALKVVAFRGTAEERMRIIKTKLRGSFNVVLTAYEALMGVDMPFLSSISWHHLIIDEGHRLKNSKCKLNFVLKEYRTQHRLLLTGTPVQNSLDELWSLLHFLMPTLFTSSEDFQHWFGQGQNQGLPVKDSLLNEEEMLLVTNRLHQALRPFMLRRLKETVASELPSKVEHVIPCLATPYQRFLCSLIEQDLKAEPQKKHGVKGVNNSMVEMRNICNHPFLSRLHPEGSEALLPPHPLPAALRLCGKLALLDDLLVKLCGAGHKVLVFSTMTRLLDIVEDQLDWRGIQYLRLDGSTASAERGELVNKFNDPAGRCSVFLLSVRAGGVGLNLQAADTIIMYDTDWNPQIDLQAQARAHRIGQTNEVLVLRLQTTNTIEEHIYNVASQKRSVADRSITGGFFDGKTDAQERRAYLLGLLSKRACQSNRGAAVIDDVQLSMLVTRDSSEAALFAEQDRRMIAREKQAWQQTNTSRDGDSAAMYSRLATEGECQALIDAARIAAEPAPAPDVQELGRGKRKRHEGTLAEMGERAFKRMIKKGELPMSSGPSGLRTVTLLG